MGNKQSDNRAKYSRLENDDEDEKKYKEKTKNVNGNYWKEVNPYNSKWYFSEDKDTYERSINNNNNYFKDDIKKPLLGKKDK